MHLRLFLLTIFIALLVMASCPLCGKVLKSSSARTITGHINWCKKNRNISAVPLIANNPLIPVAGPSQPVQPAPVYPDVAMADNDDAVADNDAAPMISDVAEDNSPSVIQDNEDIVMGDTPNQDPVVITDISREPSPPPAATAPPLCRIQRFPQQYNDFIPGSELYQVEQYDEF
ncbi:hypothetical protein C8J56DRAFT_945694 [Mycena floridula]|nr:hypothetical protein C8J56DRAFT_945694 [Mycena floridula]